MTTYIVPTSEQVTDLLQMLYGDVVSASDADLNDVSDYRIATFVDDSDTVVAAIVCDIECVVYSGAALSMIPPGGAQDMVSDKEATQAVLDNFHEVMNICSKLLMTDTGAHLRLGRIMDAAEVADSVSVQAVYTSATKVGFGIDIADYGAGKMAVLVT